MNPANLKRYMQVSRTLNVSDQFRTNNLSLTPGGSVVEITYNNGKTLSYDKVKNPKKYIQSLSNYKDIIAVKVDGEPFNF
jgi:hypothetical protein